MYSNRDQYQKLESNQSNTQKVNQSEISQELARVCKEMDFYSEQLHVYIDKHQNTDDMKTLNNMDEKIRLLLQLIQRVQSDTHKIQSDKIKSSNEKIHIQNQITSKNISTNTTFNPFKPVNNLTLGDSFILPSKQNQLTYFQLPAPVSQQFSLEQKQIGKQGGQDNQQQQQQQQQQDLLAFQNQDQLSSNNQEKDLHYSEDYVIENQKKYTQYDSKDQIYKNNTNKINKKRKQNEQFEDNFNKMNNNKDIHNLKSHKNDNIQEYESIQKQLQIQGSQARLIQNNYGSSKPSQQQQQLIQQQHFQMPNQNINSVNQTYSQIQQQQLQINQIQCSSNNIIFPPPPPNQIKQNVANNQDESSFLNQKDIGSNTTLNNGNFQSNSSNLPSNFNTVQQIQAQKLKAYQNKPSSNLHSNSQSNSSSGSYSRSHSKSLQQLNKVSNNLNQIDTINNNDQSHHDDNMENFLGFYPNQSNQPNQQQEQNYHNQNFMMSGSSNDTHHNKMGTDDQGIDLYHESFHDLPNQMNHHQMLHHSKSMGSLRIKIKKQNLKNGQQQNEIMEEIESENNLIQSQNFNLKTSDMSLINYDQNKILMSKSLGESDRNVGNNQSQNTFITDNERTKSSNNNSNFLSNSTTLNNMQSAIHTSKQDRNNLKKEEESEYENDIEESQSEQTPLANQDFKFKNEQMVSIQSKSRAFDTRNVIKNLLTFLKKYLISITIPQNMLAWQDAQKDFQEYINNYKGHDVKSSRSIIQNYPLVHELSDIQSEQLRQDLEIRLINFPSYPLHEQIQKINYFNSLVRRYSMTYLTVIMPQIIQKNGMFVQKESIQRFCQLFLSYIKNPTSYLRIQS